MKNLTEVSKGLVKAYMKKAYNSMADAEEKAPTQDAGRSSTEHFKNRETVNRRKAGLKIAGEKMMGKAKVKLSENYLNRVYGTKTKETEKPTPDYLKRVLASSQAASKKSTSAPTKKLNEGEINRHDTSKPTLRRLTPVEILNKKLGRERAQNQQVRTQINEVLGLYLKD